MWIFLFVDVEKSESLVKETNSNLIEKKKDNEEKQDNYLTQVPQEIESPSVLEINASQASQETGISEEMRFDTPSSSDEDELYKTKAEMIKRKRPFRAVGTPERASVRRKLDYSSKKEGDDASNNHEGQKNKGKSAAGPQAVRETTITVDSTKQGVTVVEVASQIKSAPTTQDPMKKKRKLKKCIYFI